jgi:hypothetical protein
MFIISDIDDPASQSALALCVGVLQGIAGPGGLLGVLPAVEMKEKWASVLYLLSFIVVSTLCMGVFAAMYGEATRRLGDISGTIEFCVNISSCALSVVVGTLWVVLSLMGKLEALFGG